MRPEKKRAMDAMNEALNKPTEWPAADKTYDQPGYYKGSEPKQDYIDIKASAAPATAPCDPQTIKNMDVPGLRALKHEIDMTIYKKMTNGVDEEAYMAGLDMAGRRYARDMKAALRRQAEIKMHEAPDMLPPRYDMRNHIDADVQKELDEDLGEDLYKKMGGMKVSYIVHMPGHKNSKGKAAPWVIKSHNGGKILSSHSSKAEAEKHLQEIEMFKSMKGAANAWGPRFASPTVDKLLTSNGYNLMPASDESKSGYYDLFSKAPGDVVKVQREDHWIHELGRNQMEGVGPGELYRHIAQRKAAALAKSRKVAESLDKLPKTRR